MMTIRDVMTSDERRRDMLRDAEHERLLRRLPAHHGVAHRSLCRALAWLGGRLSAWGGRLQERYAQGSAPQAMA